MRKFSQGYLRPGLSRWGILKCKCTREGASLCVRGRAGGPGWLEQRAIEMNSQLQPDGEGLEYTERVLTFLSVEELEESLEQKRDVTAEGVAQVIQHLLSRHEAMSSNPSVAKKDKKKKKSALQFN
jgi:hypothetical protein